MNIVIAADEKFKAMAEFSVKKAKEFGYHPIVYDLGGLGFGRKFEIAPAEVGKDEGHGGIAKSYFKPRVIRDAFNGEEFLVWLDADAFIVKPIDDALTDDYDVGVTMRRQRERGGSPFPDITGYLNAGVIFFNRTDKASEFIDKWEEKRLVLEPPNDQYALTELVMEATDLTEYDRVFVRNDGIRIKVFKCEEYNCYYLAEGLGNARILHFKGRARRLYWNYAK